MKQKYKDLLLKDLCARLLYGVKINYLDTIYTIDSIGSNSEILLLDENGELCPKLEEGDLFAPIEKCKPYLFPISSMTTELKAELSMLTVGVGDIFKSFLIEVEFYNKHHIDYNGLIDKGLAIDASNLNIYD